jgi:hypothetical protein
MSMSKQNYVAIAAILKRVGETHSESLDPYLADGVAAVTAQLADYFGQDNPRFDRERFLAAAKPDPDLMFPDDDTYKIVRFYQDPDHPNHRMVVRQGLTLAEAQEHCNDEATHGDGWFDGYEAE